MRAIIKLIPLAAALVTLSACASARPALQSKTKNLGTANHANIAAHAVTPDPKLKADTYIPANRARVRTARENYEKGEVIEPKPFK